MAERVEIPGVRVKPLEWWESCGTFYAESILGLYTGWEIGGVEYMHPPKKAGGIPCADFRAAAEAHLAERILSALEPTAELTTLREREAVLVAALKPFAQEADEWPDSVKDKYRPGVSEPGSRQINTGARAWFTIGDLRRARALTSEGQV